MIARPPTSHADDVRNDTELSDSIQHIGHRYAGISVVRVLLCLDGEHQTRVLEKSNGAVVARIIRQQIHDSASSKSVTGECRHRSGTGDMLLRILRVNEKSEHPRVLVHL